jgi:hypothetical protein
LPDRVIGSRIGSLFRFLMTTARFLLAASPLLFLTACASKSADLQTLLQNPLYAEQYYDAQVDNMVNMLIGSGELLRDPEVKAAIDESRLEGLRLAQEATAKQSTGKMGIIASDTEEAVGEVLLVDNILYLGPEFQMLPGVDVRVYLSETVDPRDVPFPDSTAVEIDSIHTSFGATQYTVSSSNKNLRTFVLYDKALKRIVGFAQLQVR